MVQKAAIRVQVHRLTYRKCKVAVSVLLSQIFISPQLLIGKERLCIVCVVNLRLVKPNIYFKVSESVPVSKRCYGCITTSSGWIVHVMIVLVRFVSAQATHYRLLLVPLNHLNGNVRSSTHDYLECLHRQAYWLPL